MTKHVWVGEAEKKAAKFTIDILQVGHYKKI